MRAVSVLKDKHGGGSHANMTVFHNILFYTKKVQIITFRLYFLKIKKS